MGMIIQNGKQYFPGYDDTEIKALPTVDTASGAIASFNTDLTENLISVKCQILAKQASGTPSPVNPLPIQTYDSLTLYHNDINMWDEQWELGTLNWADGSPVPSTSYFRAKNYIPCKPNTTYRAIVGSGITLYAYDENKVFTRRVFNNQSDQNFTTQANEYYLRFRTFTEETTYQNNISINYPSSDTQYHAFNGAYIPFGQTVANGVLDITTGKLRVTHRYVKPATDFELQNGVFTSRYDVSGIKQAETTSSTNLIIKNCNMFNSIGVKYRSEVTDGTIAKVVGANNQIACFSTAYSDVADFNTRVIQQGLLEIVYEYATPIEIQLDSITLQALLNENNIWCDTGDTEVKYLLTVGKKIA